MERRQPSPPTQPTTSIVTGSDTQNQYESYVTQVTAAISVTGPNGSISFTTPNVAGYTFTAYIGTTTSPANLALSPSGPTTGPLAGQATQLPANTVVTLTGIGVAQTPPASGSHRRHRLPDLHLRPRRLRADHPGRNQVHLPRQGG